MSSSSENGDKTRINGIIRSGRSAGKSEGLPVPVLFAQQFERSPVPALACSKPHRLPRRLIADSSPHTDSAECDSDPVASRGLKGNGNCPSLLVASLKSARDNRQHGRQAIGQQREERGAITASQCSWTLNRRCRLEEMDKAICRDRPPKTNNYARQKTLPKQVRPLYQVLSMQVTHTPLSSACTDLLGRSTAKKNSQILTQHLMAKSIVSKLPKRLQAALMLINCP